VSALSRDAAKPGCLHSSLAVAPHWQLMHKMRAVNAVLRTGRALTTEDTSTSISPARSSPICASSAAANAREKDWMSSREAEPYASFICASHQQEVDTGRCEAS